MSTFIIDDSKWDTPRLSLSPGWNMLGPDAKKDHILDPVKASKMRAVLSQFRGQTVSWTTAQYSSSEINFNGTGIDVWGLAGPAQGVFSAVLDSKLLGGYNAYNDVDRRVVLFSIKGLAPGQHNLTMINLEGGKALTLDYAEVQTGVAGAVLTASSSSAASSTVSSASHSFSTSSRLLPATSVFPTADFAASQPAPTLSAAYSLYEFAWTPLVIFSVAFGGFILLLSILGTLYLFLRRRGPHTPSANDRFPGEVVCPDSESTSTVRPVGGVKLGRRRTLMEALRARRIGAPKLVDAPVVRDFRMDSDGSRRKVDDAVGVKDGEWDV